MGSVGANKNNGESSNPLYKELMDKLNNTTSTLRRNFEIERSDLFVGRQALRSELWDAVATKLNKGDTLTEIGTFMYDTAPDKDGYADVYVHYFTERRDYAGHNLGGAARIRSKKKDGNAVVRVKVLNL